LNHLSVSKRARAVNVSAIKCKLKTPFSYLDIYIFHNDTEPDRAVIYLIDNGGK